MKKVWKWIRIIGRSLIVLFIALLLIGKFIYNPFELSTAKRIAYFEKNSKSVIIENISTKNGNLQTVISKENYNSDSILVCFIHGAPGSGMDFKNYIIDSVLSEHAKLMIVDRPGYGNSTHFYESISDQASDIFNVIQQTSKYKELILVGHSYGCAIAAKIAIEHPDFVSKVIFLAAVIDPFDEKVFWYTQLFDYSILNWLLPKSFQTAVFEKMNHKEHLVDLHTNWKKLKTPILMIHGKKDTYLAPFNNVTYAKKNIPEYQLVLQIENDMGHLIPFINKEFTKSIVLKAILELNND